MKIGKAAELSKLSVKTVRYYAEKKIVCPVINTENAYREYSSNDVAKLQFVAKARLFNFSLKECKELLSLYENKNRSSKEVKSLTLQKISEINSRLEELESLRNQLNHLASCCQGDERPDCPIIDALSRT